MCPMRTRTSTWPIPQVRRLEVELSEDHATAEFEQALEDLLDRLDPFTR